MAAALWTAYPKLTPWSSEVQGETGRGPWAASPSEPHRGAIAAEARLPNRQQLTECGMSREQNPPSHIRTRNEVLQETREQLQALESLFASLANGELWAGKLMATVIYTICHDGKGKTKSLISQLGYRNVFQCITTAHKPATRPGVFQAPLTLAIVAGSNGLEHVPRGTVIDREQFKKIPFVDWWDEAVFQLGGRILSRKELVGQVRSKDGGSHFDRALTSTDYLTLKSGGGWQRIGAGSDLAPEPLHLFTVASIAWELNFSFMEISGQPIEIPDEDLDGFR